MGIKVAIMGATGAVGTELLDILAERKFPISELRLLASVRSAGKTLQFQDEDIKVRELTHDSFKGIDLVLASAGGKISKEYAPSAVKAGAVVVDNTSHFRMAEGVPLVIPEINPVQTDTARNRHARQVQHGARDILDVLEHGRRHHGVERGIRARQCLHARLHAVEGITHKSPGGNQAQNRFGILAVLHRIAQQRAEER